MILNLEFLNDAKFWVVLVASEDLRTSETHHAWQATKFAMEHLPKLTSLLARDSDQIFDPEMKDEKPLENGLGQLTVTVIEEHQLSSPQRLVLTLQSIDGLYRACAQLMGESEEDLCVIACDSGSDKSFDFLCVAKVVECVKEVILSFWDRVVYFRDDKTGRRLELFVQSLPILDKIAAMKQSG